MSSFTNFKIFLVLAPILLGIFFFLWYKERDERKKKSYKIASIVTAIICVLTYLYSVVLFRVFWVVSRYKLKSKCLFKVAFSF